MSSSRTYARMSFNSQTNKMSVDGQGVPVITPGIAGDIDKDKKVIVDVFDGMVVLRNK